MAVRSNMRVSQQMRSYKACSKCGERGHKVSSCPLIVKEIFALVKKNHKAEDIKAFLDEHHSGIAVTNL